MCGAINVDLLATADHKPLPDDSTPGRLYRCAGGVGRNIAENLVRLGIDVSLVSAVGDDDLGRWVVDRDRQTGVDISHVQINSDWPTASYTAIHSPDGELLNAVSDMRLFDQFSLSGRQDVDGLQNTDLLVIDANLPEPVINELVQSYYPKFIAAEAVSQKKCLRLTGVLPLLSLLKVNRAEASVLTGCSLDDEQLLDALLQMGPARVLLTKGEAGATLASKHQTVHSVPDSGVDVVSTNGVGDAMFSGVLAAHLYGLTAEQQLKWGATASVETLGVHSACTESLSLQTMGR